MNTQTQTPRLKYYEWRSPEELRKATKEWTSEIELIKDELFFLKELIKTHTFELLSHTDIMQIKGYMEEFLHKEKECKPLLQLLQRHDEKLALLNDGIDQLEEEKEIKRDHLQLLTKITVFTSQFKDLKTKIIGVLREMIDDQEETPITLET